MRIYIILLIFGLTASHVTSGVFWNGKNQMIRIKTRPVRHYSSAAFHQPHNRVYKPVVRYHRRQPFSYFPPPPAMLHRPVNYGSMVVNAAAQHQHQTAPPNNLMRRPIASHRVPSAGEPFHRPRPRPPSEFPKFQSPISNFVESPGVKEESDNNQHGYLSPTYSGWKPISKPYYSLNGPQSETTKYYPTTEAYLPYTTTRKQNLMMNTLFRDNVKHVKPLHGVKLKPEYSENRGVAVPLPPQPTDSYRVPPAFLNQQPTYIPFHPQNYGITASESEENPVAHKPFPKFSARPKQHPQTQKDSDSGSEVSTDTPQLLSKFKISRPKLKIQSHASFQNNEPEIEELGKGALPKVTLSATANGGSSSPPHNHHLTSTSNLHPKAPKLRPRVKVTKEERKPEGFVNTEQLSHVLSYRPHAQTPGSQKERDGDSNSRQPTSHHPSPTYLGNETYDVIPFRPGSFPSDFPSSSTFSSDFMNGFGGSDERNQGPHVPPRSEIIVPGHKTPKGQSKAVGGSGFRHSVVERPFQNTQGETERRVRRKKIKHNHHQQHFQETTTNSPSSPSSSGANKENESPSFPEDFYMPPGFPQNPSLGGHGENPVSFMTMPNAQPQLIHHHTPQQYHHNQQPSSHPQQQNVYPINFRGPQGPYDAYPTNSPQPPLSYSNPIYSSQQKNKNYVFLNIQNGQTLPNTGGQENFQSETQYQGYAPQQPFYHQQATGQGNNGGPLPLEFNQNFPNFEGSSTPRNLYRFPISSPPLENFEYQQQQQHPHSSEGQTRFVIQDPNANLAAYASNEYERIPMEFMNDLRPILLEDSTHSPPAPTLSSPSHSRNIFQQTLSSSFQPNLYDSTATRLQGQSERGYFKSQQQNSLESGRRAEKVPFYSSEVNQYPASSSGFMRQFLDNVPRPFQTSEETPSGEQANFYLLPNHHQVTESQEKGYENYKSSASNFQPQVVKHKSESINSKLHQTRPPTITMSPLTEYSIVTTISPMRDFDFSRPMTPASAPTKWSKLKLGDGAMISSTDGYYNTKTLTNKYKKLVTQDALKISAVEQRKVNWNPSTSPPSSTTTEEAQVKLPQEAYSHPTPLVYKNMSSDGSEDDSSDSNIPKSAKVRTKEIHSTAQSSTTPASTTTSYNSNRRQFRRRRPGMLTRRPMMLNSSRTVGPSSTTHKPGRITTSSPKKIDDGDLGFESFRVKQKHSQNERAAVKRPSPRMHLDVEAKTTTPSSDPIPVTYGETQWFKIKEKSEKSEELEYYTGSSGGGEEKKASSPENEGNDVPDPRKRKEGEKISFSSRILSATPHVKLEPLGQGFEGVQESRSLSNKNFYSTGAEKELSSLQP